MLEHKLDMGTADLHTKYNLFMPVNLQPDTRQLPRRHLSKSSRIKQHYMLNAILIDDDDNVWAT